MRHRDRASYPRSGRRTDRLPPPYIAAVHDVTGKPPGKAGRAPRRLARPLSFSRTSASTVALMGPSTLWSAEALRAIMPQRPDHQDSAHRIRDLPHEPRPAARRVGKECGSTRRSRESPDTYKKKKKTRNKH